ncbi:hypothetical protein [Bremerella sp. P1]|uniref:hypothetical protein n=1 Tax=Bremerella sp. P1 TaxID=3026424 RepID=UPI0023687FDB|nr:hypothetical protein [Bremerella sp. P1]WDI42615.1 hypothetical protein PSR63_01475 [Bremerella sp. P1]
MLGRILIGTMLLVLAGSGHSLAQENDHWRVTVQDVALLPLAVSADGTLAAGRGKWAKHLFHVVNQESSQVLLTVHMPRDIQAVAIAGSGDWFVVSTTEHIYRIDLNDGSPRRLLEGVTGALAIDPADEKLAVLGNLKVPLPATRSFGGDVAKLGVFDLKLGQWIAQIDTPVRTNFVVAFDGDEVIAAGTGGNIRSRKAQGYDCHAQLNLSTGKIRQGFGPDRYDDRMNPPQADPEYKFPPSIERWKTEIAAAMPRTQEGRSQYSAHRVGFPGGVWALVADDQRIASVMDHGDAQRSLLTIPSTGNLSVRDGKVPSSVDVCRGRLLHESAGHVTDLETGQEVLTLPQFKYNPKEKNQWTLFVGPGWLVRDRDQLSYYAPEKSAPVWQREAPEGFDRPTVTFSPDASRFTAAVRDTEELVTIFSASDGKVIQRIMRTSEKDAHEYISSVAFNRDGSELLVQHYLNRRGSTQRSLRLYDLSSGQIKYERVLGEKEYLDGPVNAGSGWMLGSYGYSLYVDQNYAETKLPFDQIDSAEPIPDTPVTTFLVANDYQQGGVVTLNGQVPQTWQGREASVAFGGRVIARSTGTSEIELLDAQTFAPFAWVHVIRLEKGFGWIAYTPDGYWDASPGVEKFVLVTKNGSVAQPAEVQSRRVLSLLQTRMPK